MNVIFDRIQKTLQWINDLEEGDMIETRGYTKTYLTFNNPTTSKQFDDIVALVNPILSRCDSRYRINWSMGEIVPLKKSPGRPVR